MGLKPRHENRPHESPKERQKGVSKGRGRAPGADALSSGGPPTRHQEAPLKGQAGVR